MANANSLFKVLLVALVIPAIGYGVSSWIISDLSQELEVDVALVCGLGSPELASACAELDDTFLLGKASIYAAVIGVSIPVLYWLAALYAGSSRRRIASIFPSVLKISLWLIAVTVLLQGAILTYAAYIGESYAIERVHFVVIGAIGLGALIAAGQLINVAFSFGEKLKMTTIGKVLTEGDAPKLFGFVQELADKLGSKCPDNIIIGLEPTFYVTSADIQVPGHEKAVSGETLFVSAPLSRLFTTEEFASVIGHELGHFRGEDTAYSMRFAPVYTGLGQSLSALTTDEDEGASGLAKLPAIAMLSFMYDLFASNVAEISRDREHKADEAGADVGSPFALSTALIKVGLYGALWGSARKQNIDRLNEGKIASNLSIVFEDSAKFDVARESIDQIKEATMEQATPHPTDSHPPVSQRLAALGVSPEDISKDNLVAPATAAIELVDNFAEIEVEITMLEHQLMVAYGLAKPPKKQEENQLLQAMYSMAAAMVGADGKIEPEEIAMAEGIGQKLFKDFDSVDFRQYCSNLEHVGDVEKLAGLLSDVLDEEQRTIVVNYMTAIAEADGHVSAEERQLLDNIARQFGVTVDR